MLLENDNAVSGLRYYTVAARSLATGELVALSQLGVDPAEPTWGHQELTAVTRPHRGHRLGVLVKVAMLELLAEREPQLIRIITGNADGNLHMIAINDELGFTVLDRWPSWEIEVAQALADPGAGITRDPSHLKVVRGARWPGCLVARVVRRIPSHAMGREAGCSAARAGGLRLRTRPLLPYRAHNI
jgi:hypothetical protein